MGLIKDLILKSIADGEQQTALDKAKALAMLREASLRSDAPVPLEPGSKYSVNLPTPPEFGPGQNFDLQMAAKKAGLNLNAMALENEARTRTQGNTLRNNAFDRGVSQVDDPAVLIDAANKKSVAPFSTTGGITTNKYSGDASVSSPNVTAQARLNNAKADEQDFRNSEFEDAFNGLNGNPLFGLDALNKRKLSGKTLEGRVEGSDKDEQFQLSHIGVDGRPRYSRVTTDENEPIMVPPSGSASSPYRLKAHPETVKLDAWKSAGVRADKFFSTENRFSNPTSADLKDKQLEFYRVGLNDPTAEIPNFNPGASAQAPEQAGAGDFADPRYSQAKAAIAAGAPLDAIKRRFVELGLDPSFLGN